MTSRLSIERLNSAHFQWADQKKTDLTMHCKSRPRFSYKASVLQYSRGVKVMSPKSILNIWTGLNLVKSERMVQRSGGLTLNWNVMSIFALIISVKIFIRGSISRIERWANGAHLQLRSYSSSIDEILLRCHWLFSNFTLHWLSSNALNLQWLRDNVYFADFPPGGTHTPPPSKKDSKNACFFAEIRVILLWGK